MKYLLITLLLAAFSMGTAVGSNIHAHLPDTLLTENAIYQYTFTDFNLACRIAQKMRTRNILPAHRMDIAEGDLYFNNGYYHHALKLYTAALKSDSVVTNNTAYMEQLHRMISTYDCLHNDTRKTEYINLLLHRAKETGNKPMHSIALFNLGKTIYYQNDKQKGYRYMHRAVEMMREADYKQKYDNLRYNYNTLLVMQQMDKLYTEALATLDALEAVIDLDSSSQTEMDGLRKKERKALLANRAVVLQRLNRLQEAEECYKEFIALGQIHDRDNYLIMPYLHDRQMYDQIIRMNTAREEFLRSQGDTVSYHISTIKRSLGDAYARKGNMRQAATYYRQLATVMDSIKRREQRSAALELATLYDTAEKEAQLAEQAGELRERNIFLASAAALVLVLGLALWRSVMHARIVRGKNRALAKNIDRQMDYKEKLEQRSKELQLLKEEMERMVVARTAESIERERAVKSEAVGSADRASAVKSETSEGINEVEMKDVELMAERAMRQEQEAVAWRIFEPMEVELLERKLYLNRNFSREDLMRLAGVGKNRISQIVQQCSGMNVNGYLNNLRLEYAVKLMRENPLYTIESIAQDSGLPNTSTFYRLFRERFSITPAEYRKGLEAIEE